MITSECHTRALGDILVLKKAVKRLLDRSWIKKLEQKKYSATFWVRLSAEEEGTRMRGEKEREKFYCKAVTM